MFEMLDERQPWEIPLPVTWEDRERILQARREGRTVEQWHWRDRYWRSSNGDQLGYPWIVLQCMNRGWQLFSVPSEAPPDPRPDALDLDRGRREGL